MKRQSPLGVRDLPLQDLYALLGKVRKEHDDMHHIDKVDTRTKTQVAIPTLVPIEHGHKPTAKDCAETRVISAQLEDAVIVGKMRLFMLERIKGDREDAVRMTKRLESELSKMKWKARESSRNIEFKREALNRIKASKAQKLQNFLGDQATLKASVDDLMSAIQAITTKLERRKEFQNWREEVTGNVVQQASGIYIQRLALTWGFFRLLNNTLHQRNMQEFDKSCLTEEYFTKIGHMTTFGSMQDIVTWFLCRNSEEHSIRACMRDIEARTEKYFFRHKSHDIDHRARPQDNAIEAENKRQSITMFMRRVNSLNRQNVNGGKFSISHQLQNALSKYC